MYQGAYYSYAVPLSDNLGNPTSSGIPEVMGYLNGVHIRGLLDKRTLCAKLWGTVMAVASGLPVGPGARPRYAGCGSPLT